MFTKIFIKEWRENILIFSLAILMMVAMVFLSLTGKEEMTLYSSGMFLLLFLPLAALLLGSGGFYNEYKDNAWVYLFSRPIKKETLWIFKFVSLLSILVTVLVIFYFVRRFLPGLDKIFQDLDMNYPDAFGDLFSLSLYIVMPLMAFTIAFSLSLLYDKQFIIFCVSILICTGLMFFWQNYIYFLWAQGFYVKNEGIFSLFFTLSFVIASILTLAKSDFSQVGKKIFRFSKYLLIFLIISFCISTVWVTRGQIFFSGGSFSFWHDQEYQGNLYFQGFRQGILRYDPDQDTITKLNKESRFSFEPFSLRAGKILFLQVKSRRQWTHDLWIMNTDGTGARPLVESSEEESPFYKKRVESFILSCDAKKIAFVTTHREEMQGEQRAWIHTLWWMNTDGTGLKSQILDVPYGKNAHLIAWPRFKDYLVLEIRQTAILRENSQITVIDLENGTSQVLAENVLSPRLWYPSPDQDYLTLTIRNPGPEKDKFTLLDLNTFESTELYSEEVIRLEKGRWSPDGHKIAFFWPRELRFQDREIGLYDLEEKKISKIFQQDYQHRFQYDWTSNGQKFLILDTTDGENQLVIMDKDFQQIKSIKIPMQFKGTITVRVLENGAILKGTVKGNFWYVDLETEEWKKVY
jgi:Tol biopolymer transport system component